ncbi:MAG: hypothetical protein HYZ84_04535, partial [Candidatus Omnitrophica bacterium]|nr:hypothetical protein [Candidatus Omnitrophota bacterium]
MSKARPLFKFILPVVIGAALIFPSALKAETQTAPQLKKQESGFYRNLFDQNIYDEATAYLHLEKAYRKIAGKRLRAGDVN